MNQPEVTAGFHLGVVLLAAGRSARMGRPKLLLPWGTTTVLGHLLSCWRNLAADQIAVVTAAADPALAEELDRLGLSADGRIVNPNPDRGMFSSIRCASRWPGWRSSLTHWAIVLGDQPHLRMETLEAVLRLAAARPGAVCQPSRGGRPRHPVVLPRHRFEQLAATEVADLKTFLLGCQVAVSESADPGLDLDIDRPEDYQRALALVKGQA